MNEQAITRKGYKQLISEANSVVITIPASEALGKLTDPNAILVDIRDLPELERDGKIPGAIHASRGMLEFYVDPESPYHKEVFASGKQILLYCASGGRSALAAQRLQEMGFNNVAHMEGGFKAWREAGGSVEPVT
jgi:rhodanese-related sulfurtransferase